MKPLASAVAPFPEIQVAIYADAEIYPDDDICKIFAQPVLLALATQSPLRLDLLSKVCGFSILKPVKNSVSDNISD